jgi:acyl-CoA synthetase (AMP-forming)/AMP-acid ligase II
MTDLSVGSVRRPDEVAAFYEAGFWQKQYITEILDAWTDQQPDRIFVHDAGTKLSWGDVRDRSVALAVELRTLGVARRDRVAAQLPNWHEFVISYLAVARLGAVLVPIMPVYREHEVAHVLEHSGARAFVYAPMFRGFDYRGMARSLAAQIESLEWRIVVRSADLDDGELSFDRLIEQGGASAKRSDFGVPSPDDHHLIVYTSGTESKAKGCLHTWNTYGFTPRTQIKLYEFERDSIELVVSPITHTTGLAAGLLKPLLGGGAIALMDVWDPSAALDLIDEVGCTQTTGATPFLTTLLDAAKKRSGGKSLQVFICGGAPVPANVIREAADVLDGCRVCTAYGQSEGLLVTGASVRDDEEHLANTDGKPLPGVSVKTIDSLGNETKPGEEGEVCYRSPGLMLGYWRAPEADAATKLPGGWRRSGDLGRIRPDGYLRVTGRAKDILIRGGMNISAREVEEALLSHPTVAAAAVVGVPDDTLGERIGAAIVPAHGAEIDITQVVSYLQNDLKMAKQKLPERLLVVESLPLNATGKVLKFQLVRDVAAFGVAPR